MMKTVWRIALFLLLATAGVRSNCSPGTSAPNAPSLPTLPSSYRVRIEANIATKNYTLDSEEYFDNLGNRAMLRFFVHGIEGRTIYSYATDELFYVFNDACTVSNLTTDHDTALFGVNVTDGRAHVYSANAALRFGKQFGETYMGQTVVRGIIVDHWQSCIQTNQSGALLAFTIDYYFSAPLWSSSTGYPAVPVRAEVTGNMTFGTIVQPLHNIYEFHRFESDMGIDPMTFEVPKGVVCPGRKNIRKLPELPKSFYYRQEILSLDMQYITHVDVWYDDDYKLLRVDYRPLQPIAPFFSTDPFSEVHDFNFGVRYGVDRVTGNCTVVSISNTTFDAMPDARVLKANGSYVVDMRNPLQFFGLDANFTYAGQRYARDALCDVYIAKRDFPVGDKLIPNVTLEYYFLSKDWAELPNHGVDSIQTDFPFRLEVTSDAYDFRTAYNFFDFTPGHPDVSVWDISPCYPDNQSLRFRVRMPGPYRRDTADTVRLLGHIQFAEAMGVSALRLQGVSLDYDSSSVFLSATLLGPTPAAAQFTLIKHSEIAYNDDKVWPSVGSWTECAKLCVENPDFVCNSFDLCPRTDGSSGLQCQLSKAHIGDDGVASINSSCDHFSRTVDGHGQPQKSIGDAYGDFTEQVYSHKIELDISEDDESMVPYVAVDTEITFGWTVPSKPLPSLSGAFSFHTESTIPSLQASYDGDFWYDSNFNLVRFDYRSPKPVPPFYSTYTLSVIHDFNTGIAYTMDRTQGNCTIGTLHSTGLGNTDAITPAQSSANSGDTYIRLKDPLEMFYLNDNYTYSGQRTVRGITCDVYETVKPNFHFSFTNITGDAIFQFFFQSSEWATTADSSRDTTTQAPVQLNMINVDTGMYVTYSYTDFSDQDPDTSVFDVAPCFDDAEQKKHFLITFDKPYHPYLDQRSYVFKTLSLLTLAKVAKLSPTRFSNLRVDYDLHNVFLTVTLLGQPDYLNYFYNTGKKTKPYNTRNYLMNVKGPDSCAATCLTATTMECNSFDFCPSSGLCLLSTRHVPDAPPLNLTGVVCNHYSRVVNGTQPATALFQAFESIKDYVYLGAFTVNVPTTGNQTVQYKGIAVRDDIIRPDPPGTSEDLYFRQFSLYKNNAVLATHDFSLPQLSVDDCATQCAVEDTFVCQGFAFCFNTGDCFTSHLHPADPSARLQTSSNCFLYSRQYLNQYRQYKGQVPLSKADSVKAGVTSADDCARACSQLSDFPCKSFDYCSSQKSCRLRKTHVLDIPASGIGTSPSCDHYSRDFSYDFNMKQGVVIPGSDDIIIADVTRDDCAKLCVEQTSMNCRSFEFCPNVTECRLSSAHPLNNSKPLAPSASCFLYTQKSASQVPPRAPVAQSQSSGMSGGAVAGIAIAVLVVGVVLGGLLTYFLHVKRKTYDMEMTTAFANNPDT